MSWDTMSHKEKKMKFKVVKRENPQNRADSKFYAAPVYIEEMGITEVAYDISDASTLNRTDIEAVLTAFVHRLPVYLKMGVKIRLGNFGRLKLGISSRGEEDADGVTAESIKRRRIIFTPSSEMKNEINKASFSKFGPNVEESEATSGEISA